MSDRIKAVIAEAFKDGDIECNWTPEGHATHVLEALEAARIAVVELPEPTDSGTFNEVDDGTAGWISFPEDVSATHPKGSVFDQDADLKPGDARKLAAALLAAADAAEASR